MQKAHLPVAPNKGTDDYRCFLLDPKVTEDSIIRAIEFIPQQRAMVHHAIVFRVTDADLEEAIKPITKVAVGHASVAPVVAECFQPLLHHLG